MKFPARKIWNELGIPKSFMDVVSEVVGDAIVENPEGVKLPGKLGCLRVEKFIAQKQLINKQILTKSGKLVPYNLDHSDGYILFLAYRKNIVGNILFADLTIFKANKKGFRIVSKAVPEYYKYMTSY